MPGIELKGTVQLKINVKNGSVKNVSIQEDKIFKKIYFKMLVQSYQSSFWFNMVLKYL